MELVICETNRVTSTQHPEKIKDLIKGLAIYRLLVADMKLYNSLYILYKFSQNIDELAAIIGEVLPMAIENNMQGKYKTLYLTLAHTIIMDAGSFKKEFQENFLVKSEPEFSDRIKCVKTITKPLLRRINRWKDLTKYRNEIIAHPMRGAEDSFSLIHLGTYDCPRTATDIFLLGALINMVTNIVRLEFSEESNNLSNYINAFQVSPPTLNQSDMIAEINDLITEVNGKCVENNRVYSLPS